MSRANPTWGTPRIIGELAKLGITVGKTTVDKYRVRRRGAPSPSWKTFLTNEAKAIAGVDFFTVPTAQWAAQQIVEAFPWDSAPKYMIRDNDSIYGAAFSARVKGMKIKEIRTAYRSPWQNPYCERIIGSIRRDCLDHVIIFNEAHLRRILDSYFEYYHRCRTHLSLAKDCPEPRATDPPENGKVIAFPKVGGLHNLYLRKAA